MMKIMLKREVRDEGETNNILTLIIIAPKKVQEKSTVMIRRISALKIETFDCKEYSLSQIGA